jgi:hypothetical protein
MVVEVIDGTKSKYYLIEKLLDGKYEKFNSNNGYICREAREDNIGDGVEEDDLADVMNNLNFGAIEEGDEDEESEDESNAEDIVEGLFDDKKSAPIQGSYYLNELKVHTSLKHSATSRMSRAKRKYLC